MLLHEVGCELRAIDRNERAAGAFDDECFAARHGWETNRGETNANARTSGGEMRGDGRREAIGFGKGARSGKAGEAHDRAAVGALARAGLNRLPIACVERGAEKRGHSRLADARVCAGDEKLRAFHATNETERASPGGLGCGAARL